MSDVLERLADIKRRQRELAVEKRLAVKLARLSNTTWTAIAQSLGETERQVRYLDGPDATQENRTSTATKKPGISASDYAKQNGVTRDTVQKWIADGLLPTVNFTVGKRTYKRIVEK